jgi:large subunit ribosomal protein L25
MERKLKAEPRDGTGKGVARKLRAAGRIPAVVYGHGIDPMHLTVDAKDLFHVLHTDAGVNVLVDLRVDSDHMLAMPREVQRDHIRGTFLHIDFLRIARDEKITVEVPIHLTGESHGVKEGGVVEHHLWNLQVECFPQDVPSSIEADISALGIGDSLKVSELSPPPNCVILTPQEETVVAVVPPQIQKALEELEAAEAEAAAEAAAAAGEAPEVEEGAEGAEGGEGEGEAQTEPES